MPDGFEEIQGRMYATHETAKVRAWVECVCMVLPHAGYDRLAEALDAIGTAAQAQYPQLESGGKATLLLADLGDTLDEVPEPMQRAFLLLTGDVLFVGLDGPKATATELKEVMKGLLDVT